MINNKYHNGDSWLWLGCLDCVSKNKLGMKKDARDELNRLAEVIIKYGTVYEVYSENGSPVNELFYKAEKNFAWSAGMFVWAVHALNLS